jgi:hypothetical protein
MRHPITTTLEGEPKISRTVMIVDADVLSRMSVADYLQHCGSSVVEGQQRRGRAVFSTEREIDVMLIDMTLSGTQDGFCLASASPPASERRGLSISNTGPTMSARPSM